MMKSMTGYGRAEYDKKGIVYLVELRSVNHRFCEISVHIPKEMSALEDQVKRWIQEYVKRGRVDAHISIKSDDERQRPLEIDWKLVDHYMEITKKLQVKYHLHDGMTVERLLQLPDVLIYQEGEQDVELYRDGLKEAVLQASGQLFVMREREGQALEKDLRVYIERFKGIMKGIMDMAPLVVEDYRNRLLEKLQEWIPGRAELDESRLLAEVAIFADKSDISEELTRLESHCEQFLEIIDKNEPVGRKLDFLIQEMNREVNTIGSKANHLSISQKIVDLKSDLEKMREQVQNIE